MTTVKDLMEILPDDCIMRLCDEHMGQGPTPYLLKEMTIIKGKVKYLRKCMREHTMDREVIAVDIMREREEHYVMVVFLDPAWYNTDKA